MKTPEAESSQFLTAIQRHRAGALLNEASAQLARVVAAVIETGKAGALVIRLDVKPAQKGHNAVVLTDKIDPKMPKPEVEASFWYATEDGELSKTDPTQHDLPFRAVDGGKPAAPVIPAAAANQ